MGREEGAGFRIGDTCTLLADSCQCITNKKHDNIVNSLQLNKKKNCLKYRRWGRRRFNPWVRKIHWRRKWQTTPVFLPGKSHGQRSLVGYHPKGCKESNTTEWLSAPTAAGWIVWSSRVLGAWLAPFRSETCQMWFYYCSWLWDLAYRIISVIKKVLGEQSLPTVLSSNCLCVSMALQHPLFLQALTPASTRL